MKKATSMILSLFVASAMASNVVNVTQPKPTKVTDAKKTILVSAKHAHVASVVKTAGKPSVMAGKQAGVSSTVARSEKPMAAAMKQAAVAVAPVHSELHPTAAHRHVVVGLSTKVKVHMRASERLLPIGEGAYQSAEAVAQRTLDSNRDCEKHRWNGCLHNDRADIVDGESYGHLRGAESATAGEAGHSSSSTAAEGAAGGAAGGAAEGGHASSSSSSQSSSSSSSASSDSTPSSSSSSRRRSPPAPAPPPAGGLPFSIPNPFAKKGEGESFANGCFKGLALTVALLSVSIGVHS